MNKKQALFHAIITGIVLILLMAIGIGAIIGLIFVFKRFSDFPILGGILLIVLVVFIPTVVNAYKYYRER